jgi:hypothetical protein
VSPQDGYHRVSINDWDTIVGMSRGCPDDRLRRLGIDVQDDKVSGSEILIAGMSGKGAGTHGYKPGEWERATLKAVECLQTEFKTVVRHKPMKRCPPQESIEIALSRAKILVTHHSNAAVDALVAGVPVFATKGVGRLASSSFLDASGIIEPFRLSLRDRRQLLADTAYAQWTPTEMRSGAAWDHILQRLEEI